MAVRGETSGYDSLHEGHEGMRGKGGHARAGQGSEAVKAEARMVVRAGHVCSGVEV